MGEVVASIELENAADRGIVSQGLRDESTVRRTTVEGVVDTSAVMLMLSENVVGRLGLERQREVAVTYADERKETRPVAGPLTIRIGNRFMNTDCIVDRKVRGWLTCRLRSTSRPKKSVSVVMNQMVWLVRHPHLGLPSDGVHVLAKLRRIGEGGDEYQPNSGVFD